MSVAPPHSGGFGGERVADHLARHRVDRRFADRQRQAGLGDRADAFAGGKGHAGARRAARDARDDQGAVGHVRVVAGVLDDSGAAKSIAAFGAGPRRRRASGRRASGWTPGRERRRPSAPHRPRGRRPPRRRRSSSRVAGLGRSRPNLDHASCYRAARRRAKGFFRMSAVMSASTSPCGLLIAAPRSGSGKTTLTLGLMRALRRRGVEVAGREIRAGLYRPRLPSGGARPRQPQSRFLGDGRGPARGARGSGFGQAPSFCWPKPRWACSTASRRRPGAPAPPPTSPPLSACRSCWRSTRRGRRNRQARWPRAAPRFDPRIRIAGVVLNKIGSPRHLRLARRGRRGGGPQGRRRLAQAGRCRAARASSRPRPGQPRRRSSRRGSRRWRISSRPMSISTPCWRSPRLLALSAAPRAALAPPGQKIAIARDAAFSFLYPHVLAGWRGQGAEIAFFSPLADEAPPA